MTTSALSPLFTPSVPTPAPGIRHVARLLARWASCQTTATPAMTRDHDLRALQQLDERQRADIGVDLLALTPPQPTFELERGLIDRLMALR